MTLPALLSPLGFVLTSSLLLRLLALLAEEERRAGWGRLASGLLFAMPSWRDVRTVPSGLVWRLLEEVEVVEPSAPGFAREAWAAVCFGCSAPAW